eukprot:80055_1
MPDNEPAQVQNVMTVLQSLLKIFGYDCNGNSNNHPNFQFMRQDENGEANIIMNGEVKQVKDLPQNPVDGISGFSAHLCRYGFGTQVAKHIYEKSDRIVLSPKKLSTLLKLSNTRKGKGKTKTKNMSNMLKQLLQWPDGDNFD